MDNTKIFHGSAIPGITCFKRASNATFGEGFYLTSSRERAEGYAFVRQETRYNGEFDESDGKTLPNTLIATVYEFEVEGLHFLDLQTAAQRELILTNYADYLRENERMIDELIERAVRVLHPNENTKETRNITSQISKGYVEEIINTARKRAVMHPLEAAASPIERDHLTFGDWPITNKLLTQFVSSLGYDGLIGREGGDLVPGRYSIGAHDTWVVFDPDRIPLRREYSLVQERSER